MNILFITYDFPYPTNSGGKTRAFNLIRFSKKNAHITLLSFVRQSFDKKNKEKMLALGVADVIVFPRRSVIDIRNLPSLFRRSSLFHSLYFEKEIERKILEIVRRKKIDIVHCESFYTGYFMSSELKASGVKQVFGTENVEFKLYEDYGRFHNSALFRTFFTRQAKKIKEEEESFYRQADTVLAVTSEEKKYTLEHGSRNTVVIENGVDISSFTHVGIRPENTLLFLGNFTYFPNVDAMRWFMQYIFPRLGSSVKLRVVGKKSTELSFLKNEKVETVEFVEDINDIYGSGTIFISPIRIGGGTNFKVLEAMAAKLPVVALADRVELFDFKNGKDILIAKNAAEFIDHIDRLLKDKLLQKSIAEGAYRRIKSDYDWTIIGGKLYNTWHQLLDEKR